MEENFMLSINILKQEKDKIIQEQKKLKKSKNLLFVDKVDAMHSVRSLSRTIDNLIGKE
jgi:hypothetical protein